MVVSSSGRVLAIPRDGNLSNGVMFATETHAGRRINRDFAEQRSTWEPLYEVTQMKGDGEAHPLLSPDDEFADYENWDRGKSLSTTREESYFGKVMVMEPGPDRFEAAIVPDPAGTGTGTYEFETIAAGLCTHGLPGRCAYGRRPESSAGWQGNPSDDPSTS